MKETVVPEFYYLILLCIICVAFTSCCSKTLATSPKELFLKTHVDLAKKYKKLNATSIGSMKNCVEEEYSITSAIFRSIKHKFSTNEEVKNYINLLEQKNLQYYHEKMRGLDRIANKEIAFGDSLYLFEYYNNPSKESYEFGLIILDKNGAIKKRFVEGCINCGKTRDVFK